MPTVHQTIGLHNVTVRPIGWVAVCSAVFLQNKRPTVEGWAAYLNIEVTRFREKTAVGAYRCVRTICDCESEVFVPGMLV